MANAAAADGVVRSGPVGFLAEALRRVSRPEVKLPAIALLVLLTASNIVLLRNLPLPGEAPGLAAGLAIAARLTGLIVLVVAILRIAGESTRPKWRPDGAFWLYVLITIASFGIAALTRNLIGGDGPVAEVLIGMLVTTVLLTPFAAWMAAIPAERPLAWNPARWVRDFGRWLPPLLLWTVVLTAPMAALHGAIDIHLISTRGAGEWFWPLALFDGALSAAIALISFGLHATAYRRVARS